MRMELRFFIWRHCLGIISSFDRRRDRTGYLENRREKGFNVIQAVILAELDGLNTPDRNGNRPLVNNDPAQPDEAYLTGWIGS